MIGDGAVVERGKPHLVQDAAVQVFTAGESLRSILSAERNAQDQYLRQRNRRRRQSWHDLNEYHSVAYYQYTKPVRTGFDQSIQCHFHQPLMKSEEHFLNEIEEEHSLIKDFSLEKKDHSTETIHHIEPFDERVHISIMTQTE